MALLPNRARQITICRHCRALPSCSEAITRKRYHTEARASCLACDVRTLVQWLSHDVLALAGPDLTTRRELFDFVAAELLAQEPEDPRRIRPVRVALQNQRDDLLAFAGVLDAELAAIARAHAVPEPLVREACVARQPSCPGPTTKMAGAGRCG